MPKDVSWNNYERASYNKMIFTFLIEAHHAKITSLSVCGGVDGGTEVYPMMI